MFRPTPSHNPAAVRACQEGERLFRAGAGAIEISRAINALSRSGDTAPIRESMIFLGYTTAAREAGASAWPVLHEGMALARADRLAQVNAYRAARGIAPTNVA